MTWNVAHNFPGAKDTYQVPTDYPDVGYDTIIAAWFTDVFTSILAIQEAIIGATSIVLLKVGGTMIGDLIIDKATPVFELNDSAWAAGEGKPTPKIFKVTTDGGDTINLSIINEEGSAYIPAMSFHWDPGEDHYLPAGFHEIVEFGKDIEVKDRTQGLILKSPNGTRYRIKVDDAGALSTEVA